ncbi:HypC/HybG/HupF family hydrogenase formation chaperone [Dactylosporangium sp. NPDC005572]|uniref:HypC/HybG/HupF family hydrogenase formation chaperone n=1 Tax=Dactylosporangium sp. NPDC005572 TaxID=3156889 RepID=UPI0033B02E7E
MCLGVPGRIVAVFQDGDAPMADVDFAGERRRICLAYLPDLGPGDYVIAHMGFALTRVDEATAFSTLALMREYGVLPAERPTVEGVA